MLFNAPLMLYIVPYNPSYKHSLFRMLSELVIMIALYHRFHLSSLTFPKFNLTTILFYTAVYSVEQYHDPSDKQQGRASASQTQCCLYSFNTPITFLMSSVCAAENTPQTRPH